MQNQNKTSDPYFSIREIHAIAAEADCDPRSVTRELRAMRGESERVRGRAGERVRRALHSLGIFDGRSWPKITPALLDVEELEFDARAVHRGRVIPRSAYVPTRGDACEATGCCLGKGHDGHHSAH